MHYLNRIHYLEQKYYLVQIHFEDTLEYITWTAESWNRLVRFLL